MTLTQQDVIELETAIDHICQRRTEDAFLNDTQGQAFLGLHRLPIVDKETLWHWTQPGNVGNDPGKIGQGNPTAEFSFTPGDPAKFTAKGPTNAQANVYLYMALPIPKSLPARVVDIRTHQIADLTGWQALEWQEQLTMGGKIYNLAWQFSFTSGVRIFNYGLSKWEPVASVPMPDFTKPVKTKCSFSLNATGVIHESIEINGTLYPVGLSHDAIPTKFGDKLTIAEQIDPKRGGLCSLAISQLDLRYV